jgi:hypothetical protein
MPDYEYMHQCLRTWGQTLYARDQYKRGPDARNPFRADRDLSRTEALSEQAFTLASAGLTQAGRIVGRPLADAFSRTAPVEAWRSAVQRNSFRKDLDAFDALLHETLALPSGREIVLGSYPGAYGNTSLIKEALQASGRTARLVPLETVTQLIDDAWERIARRPMIDYPQP